MQTYQTAVPQSGEAYASSSYIDELAIAALFLALTESTNATAYYADAVKWYYSGSLGQQFQAGDETVFNWDSKTPGVAVLAAQLASAYPDIVSGSNATLGVWQGVVEGYFDIIVNANGRSHLTDGQSCMSSCTALVINSCYRRPPAVPRRLRRGLAQPRT